MRGWVGIRQPHSHSGACCGPSLDSTSTRHTAAPPCCFHRAGWALYPSRRVVLLHHCRSLDYNYFLCLPLANPDTSARLEAFRDQVLAQPDSAEAGAPAQPPHGTLARTAAPLSKLVRRLC